MKERFVGMKVESISVGSVKGDGWERVVPRTRCGDVSEVIEFAGGPLEEGV